MNLKGIIKELRRKKGLSQAELGEMSGLSANYIGMLEGGKKSPTIKSLKGISTALEIPLPILTYMALEESDINPDKREGFQLIQKAMNAMLQEFFEIEGL